MLSPWICQNISKPWKNTTFQEIADEQSGFSARWHQFFLFRVSLSGRISWAVVSWALNGLPAPASTRSDVGQVMFDFAFTSMIFWHLISTNFNGIFHYQPSILGYVTYVHRFLLTFTNGLDCLLRLCGQPAKLCLKGLLQPGFVEANQEASTWRTRWENMDNVNERHMTIHIYICVYL